MPEVRFDVSDGIVVVSLKGYCKRCKALSRCARNSNPNNIRQTSNLCYKLRDDEKNKYVPKIKRTN